MPKSSLKIRPLTHADLSAVADVHQQIFVDNFLSHLGNRFLELFYAEFIDTSNNYGFVAIYDDQIVASLLGTTDSNALFNRFYSSHWLRLSRIVAQRTLTNSYVRQHAFQRIPHIRRAILSVFRITSKTPSAHNAGADTGSPRISARLLSIGILSEYRGQGIAERLVEYFVERLAEKGEKWIGLSVDTNNSRAIAFYEKNGWQREKTTSTSLSFYRPIPNR